LRNRTCFHNPNGRMGSPTNGTAPYHCCVQCAATLGCRAWTWWDGVQCALFSDVGPFGRGNCVSGTGVPQPRPPSPPKPPRPPWKPGSPNILFLQCDEMDGRVLDPDHPLSRVTTMPNLEALAKRGVNFVRAYAANPICACSRSSTFTGRFSSSIRAFSNVKSLTATIGKPDVADPNCASIIGYSSEWCVEQGRLANVSGTGTINTALAATGYDVHLFGKMDTGGGSTMMPPGATASGYHVANHADWRHDAPIMGLYYPGCTVHSWARGANITRPAFVPLEQQGNRWVDDDRPQGGPYPGDWKAVSECVKFLEAWTPADGPFALYCSVVDPHPPFWSRSTPTDPGSPLLSPGDPGHAWIDQVNETALNLTLRAIPWAQTRAEIHPADWYTSVTDGVEISPSSRPFHDRALAQRLTRAYHGQTAETDYVSARPTDGLR
jgi:arylsulfatase A-like enzyme